MRTSAEAYLLTVELAGVILGEGVCSGMSQNVCDQLSNSFPKVCKLLRSFSVGNNGWPGSLSSNFQDSELERS